MTTVRRLLRDLRQGTAIAPIVLPKMKQINKKTRAANL
jgi:hypothetical protein